MLLISGDLIDVSNKASLYSCFQSIEITPNKNSKILYTYHTIHHINLQTILTCQSTVPTAFLYFCIAIHYTIVYNNTKRERNFIMATKSANVLARVEPEVKEQAESIMSQLGLPASVVINALYKQIIMTRSIPFSLALPKEPSTLDTMDIQKFNSIMEKGLEQAKADQSRPVNDVFADLRQGLQ